MGGCKTIYAPPKERFVARCDTNGCRCAWVNLYFGWLRVWPLKNTCWGRWLPQRLAGACFRAFPDDEKPIGHK